MSLGGVVGAVAGFFLGGPKGALYGYQIGSMAGSLLDPPKGPHIESVGPRLGDLSVQTSTYGAVIPRGYGTFPVVGNVFWLENNRLKEVATTTSSSGGGKGGGGGTSTTTTYSYYATFAVGLCEGPIAGVRRIWVGPKLVYDAGSVDLAALSASADASKLFTVHYGTDTQQPDDRMQATLGIADTPAYRGLAYIVFKDYPLAAHGNSLVAAQVKVEVVRSGPVQPLSFLSATATPLWSGDHLIGEPCIDPYGYTWRFSADLAKLYRLHSQSGAITVAIPAIDSGAHPLRIMGVDNNGNMMGIWWAISMVLIEPSGRQTVLGLALPGSVDAVWGVDGYWAGPLTAAMLTLFNASGYITANAPTAAYRNITAGNVLDGWIHFTYYVSGSGRTYVGRFDPVANLWQTLFEIATGYTGEATSMSRIVADRGERLYIYSAAQNCPMAFDHSGNVVATGTPGTGLPRMRVGNHLLSLDTSTSRWYLLDADTLVSAYDVVQAGWPYYDGFGTGMMMVDDKAVIVLDIVAAGAAPLSSIVSAECLASNLLDSGDIDVAALSQAVRGYRVAAVAPIRSALEPLQGCWPFDAVQHGYQIKFVPRGGSSIATVPATDLDARSAGAAPGVAITSVREMDSMLPARVSVKFIDVDREYDDGEQYAERLNTAAVNIRRIDVGIVLDADEAAAIAERLLYLYWLERYDVDLNLPGAYNAVEPADIITVNAVEGDYTLRLAAITYTADGRLEAKAKYHSAATYLPTAQGEAGQSTGQGVIYLGDSSAEMLDIPLLTDAMNTPGYLIGMCGYDATWPGGAVYVTSDGGQTWTALQGFPAPGAVIGIATAAIGAGRTDLIDKASMLSVSLRSGELASVTEAAMLNGANHFAYGVHGRWEIIAAQTCALQGDGTYTFTDLLRGRAGTEWACALHAANDTVVAIDSARLPFVHSSLGAIGSARTYRAITNGKGLSAAPDIAFTYAGVNLECLAPIYLNGSRHPSTNDWTLSWIRRTRVGGEWRDYVDAPLSEASESYEVDIFSSGTYTTLKRTLSGLATPAATYTSAQQVADFGSNQATLYVKVYQLSANVGRGYPLTTSITR